MTFAEKELLKRLIAMNLPISQKAEIVRIEDPIWKWRIKDESILYMVGIGSAVPVEDLLKARDLGVFYPTYEPNQMEIVRIQ